MASLTKRRILVRSRWLLARAFPNVAIALLVLGGFASESVLLALAPEPIYHLGGAATAFIPLAVFWIWLTTGWIVWRLARWSNRIAPKDRRLAGIACKLCIAVPAVALIVLHVASWGFYLRCGQFANLDVVLFLFQNPPQTTWLYLTPDERTALTVLAAVATVLLVLAPLFLRWAGKPAWRGRVGRTKQTSAWSLATIALLIATTCLVWDYSPQRRSTRFSALRTGLNPMVTLLAGGIERWTSAPIAACIDPQDLAPLDAVAWQPPPATPSNRPSIIILAIESMRHDVVYLRHQGREVTPNLNRLARNGWHLTRAYAQSTHSDYADVCIVSSLYPLRSREHHYYRKSDPWPKELIYDLLKPAGYRTAIISSQNEAWGSMDQFLDTKNLDLFYDAKRSDAAGYVSQRDPGLIAEVQNGTFSKGCLYDSDTVDKAIAWMTGCVKAGRPFFFTTNLQASHFPYELEPGTPRPFQPCRLDSDVSFMYYPVEKTANVRNAYYNALHACDVQLGRIVAALEALHKLDDVILVVTGENGEAFHENGSVGHGREPVEPAVHIAAVIHAPKYVRPRVDDYPFQHVDLLPSLFSMMGWPGHPNFQGIDLFGGKRPPLDERLLFFHVLCPAARADAVLLAGRWKYMYSYDQNGAWLFDLKTDPGESKDASAEFPDIAARLRNALQTWRERQLAYYHYPIYYQSYFPPKPPQLLEPHAAAWAAN